LPPFVGGDGFANAGVAVSISAAITPTRASVFLSIGTSFPATILCDTATVVNAA